MAADGEEVTVALHIHSRYSDGSGDVADIVRAAQGLVDVVWLTDHDTLAARDRPGEGRYGSVLLLVGTEMTPPTDHVLCLGVDTVPPRDGDWDAAVQAVVAAGGLAFVAHPEDPGNARLRLPSYRWTRRTSEGFTGLEVWNHLSQWMRPIRGVMSGLRAVRRPWENADRPDPAAVRLWDELGRRRKIVGVAGIDAHAVRVGPVTVFPYRLLFRTALNRVLLDAPLTGEPKRDQGLLVAALAAGRVFMVNGRRAGPAGFRFWAERADETVPVGGEVAWAPGWTLKVRSPAPSRLYLMQDGRRMSETQADAGRVWDIPVSKAGVYRVEAFWPGRVEEPWLFSNPIYFRA
jgi:hypothetical protein